MTEIDRLTAQIRNIEAENVSLRLAVDEHFPNRIARLTALLDECERVVEPFAKYAREHMIGLDPPNKDYEAIAALHSRLKGGRMMSEPVFSAYNPHPEYFEYVSQRKLSEAFGVDEVTAGAAIAQLGYLFRQLATPQSPPTDALAAAEWQAKIVKWLRQLVDHHTASAKLHDSVHEPTLASHHEALASAINIAADMIERGDILT